MNQTPKHIIWGAAILGTSLVLATCVVAVAFYKVKNLSTAIAVTGSSQQTITSDVVEWQSSFSRNVTPEQLTQGYSQMKSDLAIVKKYLASNNVPDSAITVDPIMVMANYDNSGYGKGGGSSIIGYQLSENVSVQSNDVEGITKVAQGSGDIINQGVIFSSQPLQYFYSKLSELKLDMLAKATQDAQMRASRIATSAGSKLGSLRSADMGIFQITPVNSTNLSDYGEYDTSSIQKQITAVVHATFSVN
jgi:hypothetical protein